MKKIKLALILKSFLQKMDISTSELARQTGVCQPVIHRMASGETDNPKVDSLRPIAKFFDISIDQLIGDAPLTSHLPKFHVEETLYNLPLLPMKMVTDWPNNKGQLSPHTLMQTDMKISEQAYGIRLKDSTMYPAFPDGTLLIIEPQQLPVHRDFVIVQLKEQTQVIFKQLLIDGKDRYLKSVNPDYPTFKLKKQDKILGVMLQARIDFRKN